MKVTWEVPFTAEFNIDEAEKDFNMILRLDPMVRINDAINDAVTNNFHIYGYGWDDADIDVTPGVQKCEKLLKARLGGVQMRMDID